LPLTDGNVITLTRMATADHYLGESADLLTLAVEEANDTFTRSGIGNVSLRVVHTQLIDYDETDGLQFDHLYRLVDGVGTFTDVRRLRDEKRADIVGLILHSPTDVGLRRASAPILRKRSSSPTTRAPRTRSPSPTRLGTF